MIRWRFTGVGEHKRSPPHNSSEEYLEPTVAANIVERAPHYIRILVLPGFDRRRQSCEIVSEHFRHAGRARRQEHPFGCTGIETYLMNLRTEGRTRTDVDVNTQGSRILHVTIGYDCVHSCPGDNPGKMFGRQIRRTDHQPPHDPIQFEDRQSGSKLIVRVKQNGPAGKLSTPAAQAGAVECVLQRDATLCAPQVAARTLGGIIEIIAKTFIPHRLRLCHPRAKRAHIPTPHFGKKGRRVA